MTPFGALWVLLLQQSATSSATAEKQRVSIRSGKWIRKNLGFKGFLKTLKNPQKTKISFFNFWVKFYTDYI